MLGRYVSASCGSIALHAALILLFLWPVRTHQAVQNRASAPRHAIEVFTVPQENSTYPGLKPLDEASALRVEPLARGSETVAIADFKFDARKVVERAGVLFPFLSPGVSLDHFAIRAGSERALVYEAPGNTRVDDDPRAQRPLERSEREIQNLIDNTWSRRERWAAFQPIVKLTRRYSANDGAMPLIFQRYTDQNALQPYQDMAVPDPRLWTQLGLAADHVLFIGFIRQYCAAHPGTRGAIELLFLLDRIAEASEDALKTLFASNPDQDLRWTRESNPDAYRLVIQLRANYRAEMSRIGILSDAALATHYARVRLGILDGILRTTPNGYRASDARFLIGAILWRQGRSVDALA